MSAEGSWAKGTGGANGANGGDALASPEALEADAPPEQGPGVIRRPGAILALLTGLNLVNYLDRYVLSAVLPKLQDDLHLSNWASGWLPTVFLIGYFATCPIFGALADRAGPPEKAGGRRKRLITLGVAVWSVATVATGLAKSAWLLFAARAAVGVGEASYATIAPTFIDELARPAARARSMAIFNAAMPVGSALGFIVGGAVLKAHGWHAAFFVAGGPGLALALLCLLIAEPRRRGRAAAGGGVMRGGELLDAARALFPIPAYRRTVLGYCAYTFAIGGFAFWAPTYVFRRHGFELGHAGVLFGAITAGTGFVGTLGGGWLADVIARRMTGEREAADVRPPSRTDVRANLVPQTDVRASLVSRTDVRANLVTCVISVGLGAPLALAAILAPSSLAFFALLVPCEIALFLSSGPVNVVLLRTAPPALRASAMALAIFSIHLLGDLWSPPLIGLVASWAPWTSAMLVVPAFFGVAFFVWWRTSVWLTGEVGVR